MAKRQGLWAEIQQEHARQEHIRQREIRESRQARAREVREAARAERDRKRQEAETEWQRKRLYVAGRKAEADAMAADLRARLAELDGLLRAGIRDRPVVTFPSLKRADSYPAFDPGPLGEPLPAPLWEHFAPVPPSGLGKVFGGGSRYEAELDGARAAFDRAAEQHATAEADRRRQLAGQRAAHESAVAAFAVAVAEHNAGIDQFQRDCQAGDPVAVAEFLTLILDSSVYPEGFPHETRTVYQPDQKEAVIAWELPPPSAVPVDRDYRYVAPRDSIDAVPQAGTEVGDRYRMVIAQVALRTIHEVLVSTPGSVIEVVTFCGYASGRDAASGQPIRPLLLQVSAKREVFSLFALAELDPVACLGRLDALVSPHPCDLEAVQPTVDFDSLLARFKFVAGMDVVAGLDSRQDLLALAPYAFEHLVRQIFEDMGMKAWNTEAIRDDGVDAVAVNNDAVFGGVCIIQARRWRNAVGVEAVRALAGVMEDKHATKGILVTTSWVTKDGHAFATRHGRIEIMEGEHVKYRCREHLGLDVLISLPKPPPR